MRFPRKLRSASRIRGNRPRSWSVMSAPVAGLRNFDRGFLFLNALNAFAAGDSQAFSEFVRQGIELGYWEAADVTTAVC